MTSNVPFDSACKSFEEDLVLYYYGEISDTERRPIEQHLSSCQSCQQILVARFIGADEGVDVAGVRYGSDRGSCRWSGFE